jgi:DDE_Tnp_1-associated
MPAMALSRVGARVVESGPDGQELAACTWQRLEALPDPRSAQGRIYPLACLIAIALCAFTAAGNDRITAVGQWIRRASQADLARPRVPWDPMAGRYRVPDEKTIRVVLDRLDPRALARALPGGRPGRRRGGAPPPASVRGYRARQVARHAKALARGRLRAVAADGKTCRGARRADGTRVHLLGVTEHGGRGAGSPRGGCQAQRDQPLHRAPGTLGPGRRRGDHRCPPHGAGEPGLAGHRQEGRLHRDRETEPAAAACPGQGPALAAGPGRQRNPRERARPRRDPDRLSCVLGSGPGR